MIAKLKYSQLEGTALRGEVNGKVVNIFMRVEVDETNIVDAIDKLKGNKWVVGLDYVGGSDHLSTLNLEGITVLAKISIETIDQTVDAIMASVPSGLRVVFKLPDTYSDMKSIYEYSQKYPNARFCGGNFIRLDGCNIGCIDVEDIYKKVPVSRIPLANKGCSCVYPNIDLDDLNSVEFYEDKSSKTKGDRGRRSSGGRKSVPKKKLSSLLLLAKSKEEDTF